MIHPTAQVFTEHIGEGTVIWQFAMVLQGTRIGRHCNINCLAGIENDVIIGDHVTVKPFTSIGTGTVIGDRVFVGPNVVLLTDRYPRSRRPSLAPRAPILEHDCTIGAGSVVLDGVRIGHHALVAAGSVVTRDVPPQGLVRGNPARLAGWVDETGVPLREKNGVWTGEDGRSYRVVEGRLQPEAS
jgi:acetyltransferase-like isoleucine patch superfamily enzyme